MPGPSDVQTQTGPNEPSPGQSLAANQAWVLASHILIYARGIILLPILIKTMGASLYGSFVLLMASAHFIYGVTSLGVDFRFRREMPSTRDRDLRAHLFYQQFLVHFCLIGVSAIMVIVHGDYLTGFLDISVDETLICLLILANFLYDKLTDYLRYTDRQKLMSLILTVTPYLNIAVIVLIVVGGPAVDITLLIWINVVTQLLMVAPVARMAVRELGLRLRVFDAAEIFANIRLGFPLTLAFMVDFILASSDRYVLAAVLGTASVGYYSPAYALGSLIILVPKALGIALTPELSRQLDQGNQANVAALVNDSLRGFVAVAIPFILCSLVVGEPILALFTNAEIGQAAGGLIPIIGLATLFTGMNVILTNLLFVHRETATLFRFSVMAAGLNLLLNIVLIQMIREIAVAAATTLISYAVVFAALTFSVRRHMRLAIGMGHLLRVLGASSITAAFLWLLMTIGTSAWVLIPACVAAVLTYGALVLLLGIYSSGELRSLIPRGSVK